MPVPEMVNSRVESSLNGLPCVTHTMPENSKSKGFNRGHVASKSKLNNITINTEPADERAPLPEELHMSPLSNLLLRTSLYGVKSRSEGNVLSESTGNTQEQAVDTKDLGQPIKSNRFSRSMDNLRIPTSPFNTEKMQLRPQIAARTDSIKQKFDAIAFEQSTPRRRNQFSVMLNDIETEIHIKRQESDVSRGPPALEPIEIPQQRQGSKTSAPLKSSLKSPAVEPNLVPHSNSFRFASNEKINSIVTDSSLGAKEWPKATKPSLPEPETPQTPNSTSYLRDIPRFGSELLEPQSAASSVNISRRPSLESQKSRITVNPASANEFIPELPPLAVVLQTIENLSYEEPSPQMMAVDTFGFLLDSRDSCLVQDSPYQQKRTKKLEKEWLKILSNWSDNSKKIKQLTRQGIPDSLRAPVWMKLADVKSRVIVGKFDELVNDPAEPAIFEIIERDINRCYPNHQLFQEKNGQGY